MNALALFRASFSRYTPVVIFVVSILKYVCAALLITLSRAS